MNHNINNQISPSFCPSPPARALNATMTIQTRHVSTIRKIHPPLWSFMVLQRSTRGFIISLHLKKFQFMKLIKVIAGADEDFIACYCLYWGHWMTTAMSNRFLKVNEVYLEPPTPEKISGSTHLCNSPLFRTSLLDSTFSRTLLFIKFISCIYFS